MTTKDWISIFSLIISGIAILISYHSNVKQSELQEKIKNKELEFSRKKIWYDRQAKVIDEVAENVEILYKNFSRMAQDLNISDKELKELAIDNNKYLSILNKNRHYFPIDISNLLSELSDYYVAGYYSYKEGDLETLDENLEIFSKKISEFTSYIANKFLSD